MSGLATYLVSSGKTVSGSDIAETDEVRFLSKSGVKVYVGHSENNVEGADAAVYTSAIGNDNPELQYAIRRGIPVVKRSELLGAIVAGYKRSVGISGSHGKTTTTAMLSHILIEAGFDPTCFIGGKDREYGNFRKGKGDYCIFEACEYKKNFLDLKPYISVVLNADKDHMESYGSEKNVIAAFGEFAKSPLSLINADDPHAEKIINATSMTFGIENPANYTATGLCEKDSRFAFTFSAARKLGRITLKTAGRHNVYNALAAAATADMLGIRFHYIKSALENFKGVERRMENIGYVCGLPAYADYAHHPKEISETLKIFEKPVVVFQPHTYSRTELLMKEFIECLKKNYKVIIYKTYPAREKYSLKGSAKTLYCKLKSVHTGICAYADTRQMLKKQISEIIENGETVVFFGAGDIYETALNIADEKNV